MVKAQIDQLAADFLAAGKNSGLGIAVVMRNPQTGELEGTLLNYGTTAKDNGQGVNSDTVYEIGSITKLFTGILLAQAVEAGKVQLDDPIQNYLPEDIHAPTYKNKPIRLEDLATHRSGLPRDTAAESLPQLYSWLDTYKLRRRPGSQYVYSNAGYALLGDILARLSETDYATLEYGSISLPLGLKDTRETLTDEQTGRLAQGYTSSGSPAGYFPYSGAMSGAGYLRSTLNDLTRFLIANMDPNSTTLAEPIALAQMVQAEGSDATTGIGLGWEIDRPGNSDERLSKGGETGGFTSYISFLRDGSSGFVLLANGMDVGRIAPAIINIMQGH